MHKNTTLNMTEGAPLRLLAVFALPLLIGNLFQQTYNLADFMIVGQLLGANALAAVGSSGSITFLFISVFIGICGGCGIVTAQFFGAQQEARVRRSIVNAALITLVFSLLTAVTSFCLTPALLRYIGTPAEILPQAVTYMRVVSASVPMLALFNYASSIQRALGDSRTPLYFLIVSCVLNIALDLLFIGAFGLGVFGAALATALSQLLAGVGSLAYAVRTNPYFRLQKADLVYDRQIVHRSVRLGVPLALQWSLIAISTTALQSVANSFGPAAMAAFTATNRLEQLVQLPFGSLSMALNTYSGQNMGAGRMERIRLGFRDSMWATVILTAGLMAMMQLGGTALVSLFVREREVIALGGQALRITSLFYLFLGIIYVTRGVLNGVGDALFSLLNGIVEVVGRVGAPLLLLSLTGLGVWTIWTTAGLTWLLAAVFCARRYQRWRRVHIG